MSFRANSELLILLIIINYNRDKYISYQHIPDSILVQFASFNTCPEGLVMSAEKGIDLKLVDFKDLDLKKTKSVIVYSPSFKSKSVRLCYVEQTGIF